MSISRASLACEAYGMASLTLEDERLLLDNPSSGLPRNRARTIKHLRAVEVSAPGTNHAIYPTRAPVGLSASLPLFLVEPPVCASLCGRQ